MREQRFPWGLGAILVLLIVGGIGFWLGSSSVAPVIVPVAAPAAPVVPAPAPVYPTYVAPHGGGFPLIPLFFGVLALFVIVKVARRAAWAAQTGNGGWSSGSSRWPSEAPQAAAGERRSSWPEGMSKARDFWNSRDVPPMVDEMFNRWYQRMRQEFPPESRTESASDEAGNEKSTDGGSLNLPPSEPPTDATA